MIFSLWMKKNDNNKIHPWTWQTKQWWMNLINNGKKKINFKFMNNKLNYMNYRIRYFIFVNWFWNFKYVFNDLSWVFGVGFHPYKYHKLENQNLYHI